ncbi:DNA-binding transcriptional regulator, LysR family [Pseudomonas flavescens]|uniref:DNA-binding transcriptional regulator, LysR family n=1 Tax=Phytopseudomonas flavescens TaxID=29435 RepID=A0A1G8MYI7_9GAMM|nr:LysR family transcriptional regulator [Pseudomonas flavescens]SDI72943.1 DNA-binding transcriptional regulator, LysR family [Pseudomonas flavescens]
MRTIHEQRLHYFVEAVRLGSVRAAADALDIAPSAVSRQIAQVESELGVELVERHRRGVKPTEAGRLVLDYFRQRQTQLDGLLDSIADLQDIRTGSLTLAIGEGFIDDISPALGDFSMQHPNVELRVNIAGTNEVIRQVAEDEAYIGLVFNPPKGCNLRIHTSRAQPLYAVVAAGHPLARDGRPAVTLDELNAHRLALPDISYGIRQIVESVEQTAGARLEPTLTCNTFSMLKQYALQGGVTLLPAFAITDEIRQGSLRAIALADPGFARPHADLVTRLGRRLSRAAERLLKDMMQRMTAFR